MDKYSDYKKYLGTQNKEQLIEQVINYAKNIDRYEKELQKCRREKRR